VSPNDDDLSAFHDDPLFRALTGPGTPEELAGEAEALAAFTAAVPARSRRRFVGRLGIAGSALGIAVAMSGGAAAAYTGSLPDPLQRFAADVFGVIGVDQPEDEPATTANDKHALPPVTTPTAATSLTTSRPGPGGPPVVKPKHHHRDHPKPSHEPTTAPSPTATPVPVTTPTPTPTPTPTETTPVPSDSITISLSGTTVEPGESITTYGRLATASGDPIAGQDVWLIERSPGQAGVAQVASGTTDADGTVTLSTPPLDHSVWLRLVTGTKVRSAPIAVILKPSLQVSVDTHGSETTILVTATGGNAGDVIDVQIRSGGAWQDFASSQLDGSGQAAFGAMTPTATTAHYRALLPRTAAHAFALTTFTIDPA
jgi:hypothetical protein